MKVIILHKVKFWCLINIKIVISIAFFLSVGSIYSQEINPKKRIIIDLGHGGKDSGAIGVNGIKEKDVVLLIANEILQLNTDLFENRLDIYLTRYKDTLISLKNRSYIAKVLKPELFISLHCNAGQSNAQGFEVYVTHASNNASQIKKSIALGLSILQESTMKLGIKERGIKFENFYVIRETTPICPTALIETGFVTNDDEAKYFQKGKNIKAMALAILSGIYNYLKL
ncbi:N-acetylmuramoyl-L-alanine amidase family protein [Flagellimonas nanhaiensis]|uniref:N-acetylmuramoyl-L-alanine amidase family protein n=1 Tax=Flagellimonas nanhaiensis TaxID=2292706 RepID=UPI001E333DDA|nr:N-acetylmuramoyl-L-alanine amidase [Allomuricauda nanhaiensis]